MLTARAYGVQHLGEATNYNFPGSNREVFQISKYRMFSTVKEDELCTKRRFLKLIYQDEVFNFTKSETPL